MYTFHSKVRYSELNHYIGSMYPSSIINYFQDCSTFQSEDLNRGLAFLQAENKVWLLNSWQLQLRQPMHLGDSIEVGTWPYAFRGFYGYRNFIMKDDKKNVLAVANSIWVYLDLSTGKPARIPDDLNGYKIEPPYPMEPIQRKLKVPKNCAAQAPFTVFKANIDSYHHINNAQYIKIAEEYLPCNFMTTSLKVEYRMQAVLGDTLFPLVSVQADHYTIILANAEQKPYAILEFYGSCPDENN